ncbi:MAG: FAD-binding oxidoreductase, partial [Halomonadaceae bacterium]
VQQRVNLSMLRLSNAIETETQLALAGHPGQIRLLEGYLSWRRCGEGKCMMTLGVTGSPAQCRTGLAEMRRVSRRFNGVYTGTALGKKWAEKRFTMPYLREALWQEGYAVDTLETATDWDNVDTLMNAMEQNLRQGLSVEQQPVHVFSHLSHVYSQGCSIYTTYVFPCADSYPATLARWQSLKTSTSALIVGNRGTISHQHGVGKDHAPWLAREKGPRAMAAITSLCREFDPQGLLNPGTLLMPEPGDTPVPTPHDQEEHH